jgi:hypothetical protein
MKSNTAEAAITQDQIGLFHVQSSVIVMTFIEFEPTNASGPTSRPQMRSKVIRWSASNQTSFEQDIRALPN